MTCRLADNVQVRQENWGLLFYHQTRRKICFVRSGDWLRPEHFNGRWTYESISQDIRRRTGAAEEKIRRALPGLTERLTAGKLITDEIR